MDAQQQVSIHASVKDATPFYAIPYTNISFNPRVREGRDDITPRRRNSYVVSIHASVKDATSLSGIIFL